LDGRPLPDGLEMDALRALLRQRSRAAWTRGQEGTAA